MFNHILQTFFQDYAKKKSLTTRSSDEIPIAISHHGNLIGNDKTRLLHIYQDRQTPDELIVV